MLKASELRLGNLILIDREIEGIVSEIRSNSCKVIYQGEVNGQIGQRFSLIDFQRLYPSPLNTEKLVRFGFEKLSNKNYNRWDLDGFEIEVQGKHFAKAIWSEESPHTTHFIGHSKYVHQLQNLYYCLTGEELKYE